MKTKLLIDMPILSLFISVVFCKTIVATLSLGVGERMTERFTKRHFEAIAKLLKDNSNQSKDQLIENLVKLFQEDNSRFNVSKFYKASGITQETETEAIKQAKAAYQKLGVF